MIYDASDSGTLFTQIMYLCCCSFFENSSLEYSCHVSGRIFSLYNVTAIGDGYVYLDHLNVVEGIITTHPDRGDAYLISELSPLLDTNNKIYSNGDSEIFSGLG